ncbi:MAG: pyridoxal-dependent decarboxylase [Pseudomonadota bacterium]
MSPEEFRRRGHEVVDWVADYMARLESFPVRAQVAPGEVRAGLPEHPPERGEPFEAVMADLERVILPGITHWQHPSFFAYFNANASGPAILGELLSAGLGVQGMLWSTSPACTELETLVLDWMAELLALPHAFHSTGPGGGVIQDSASSATLCAILAARERASGWIAHRDGSPPDVVVYGSTQTHSSLEKAVRVAGIGTARLRLIGTDAQLAMDPVALKAAIAADLAAGLKPCCVVATIGTTSTTAVDPVRAIGEACREHGLWLHVDGAHGGTAALLPELRWTHDGLDLADSYCFNPHKWMFVNFDCDCFWVRDRAALVRTLSVLPEYLRNAATASGEVIDYRDWQVPLGRRFRALKLWLVLRHYGAEGLRAHVAEHLRLAAWLEAQIAAHPAFELAAPRTMNLVCFRLRGDDDRNQALMDRLNASGALFLTHTRIGGRLVLRMCLGGVNMRRRHVEAAWGRIRSEVEA